MALDPSPHAPDRSRPSVPRGLVPAAIIVVSCVVFAADGAALGGPTIVALFAIALVVFHLIRSMAAVQREVEVLVASEARFRALVQQSSDVTLIISPEGTITWASPSVVELLGESTTEVEGCALATRIHPEDAASLSRFLRAAGDGDSVVAEWRVKRGDTWVWTENSSTDLRGEPAIEGIVVSARDISERRSLEARLTHQAYHDSLTRLANRSLFLNRVAHAIARAPRGRRPSAVLFLDLDDFKKVNDSLGHGAGDELLVACASRLATCVRPGDTIARLGGDEFAVLLEAIHDLGDAIQIAERIGSAMRGSFTIHGREVFVGVSIGLAEVSTDLTPEEVLRNADLAMYFAKSRDKGRYAIFAPEMHAQLVDRLELEADLRSAVDADEIEIEYQPIVHLVTGDIYGAEALVRWRHSRRGALPPSMFVGLAEETGLIIPVGRRVLTMACQQAQEWRSARHRARELQLSVNVSGRHFMEPTLIDDVQDALRSSALQPEALTLEITESVLMQRSESTLDRLTALKGLGVRLAIDDFGTGYSSLGYLQRFPIDILKIDRSFVEEVASEDADPVLVRAILALGRTLQIETVAEGIERPEQCDGLRALGCQLGQGFYFARSLTPSEFDLMLERDAVALPVPPRTTVRPTPVS
jgi:diguanylate cyclase (GGDEF)-like protein/PAS domain S-box-containing protein